MVMGDFSATLVRGARISMDETTTADDLAKYAREFHAAAIAADEVLGVPPLYRTSAPVPVLAMTAYSLELGLKSYLRAKGVSMREIIGLGHALTSAWDAAVAHDIGSYLDLTDQEMDTLKLLSDLHVSHSHSYIRGDGHPYPVFGRLEGLTKKILDAITHLTGSH